MLNKQSITIHLQKIPLLAGVDAETYKKIGSNLYVKKVARGCHVFHKGSVGEYLFFLLVGRLQVIDFAEDGRAIGLNFLNPGDYFGELSIIDGLTRSASVMATENSVVASLSRTHALALITQNPLIAERLLRKMAASVRTVTNYRAILGIPNAFQRVFALLNQFATVAPGGLVVIDNIPTQQEMAIMVNTSRETVSRAVRFLIQDGIVEKDLRRLIIRKPNDLKNIYISIENKNEY
ncbi:Crp/Fnr family transcriptional regulator [Rhodoferax sp.]|uniref:Crp/Fnr family transcriptional regulator n=1 Tax=Rhodoferax sp. TaxID=50421 RepID=UPI002607DE13|nr:Crp/Fnr family transcriptional regulator [Rhodoferax sp.]MDD5478446.1 Crp/Fnr family transcriptional regulator [Rhodoferax sp.]